METRNAPLYHIQRGDNDRTVFKKDALDELAASLKESGMIQPISVRETLGWNDTGNCPACGEIPAGCTCVHYQIIAGERRFRAANLAGMKEVPILIHAVSDEAASIAMLVENVNRADIDPVDEGIAYQSRMSEFGWDAKMLAQKTGVKPGRVIARVKLLRLHPDIQDLLRKNSFPLGYAQTLAEAELDTNRQFRAIAELRNASSPTPGWWRKVVGALEQEQQQQALFDGQDYSTPVAPMTELLPPEPMHDAPPLEGSTILEIIGNQSTYWLKAAKDWNSLGKTYQKQQCVAVAMALQTLRGSLEKVVTA